MHLEIPFLRKLENRQCLVIGFQLKDKSRVEELENELTRLGVEYRHVPRVDDIYQVNLYLYQDTYNSDISTGVTKLIETYAKKIEIRL